MDTSEKLPNVIVGVDVETTGLDPTNGEIIEVSAIRYQLDAGRGVVGTEQAEFTRLTKPRGTLSAQITAITGITPQMVENQPEFSALKDQLQEFIGDSTIFAHNASFDVGFLTHHGLTLDHNPVWDTFALAGVAWPEVTSYNLGMLASQLKITVEGEHRAGDDVRLTWQLLQHIYQQLSLSPAAGDRIRDLLKKSGQGEYAALFRTSDSAPPPREEDLPPRHEAQGESLDNKSLDQVFSADGPLAKALPKFTHRPEQLAMAQAIEKIIERENIGLIEAGTGTGKTYAYLVPLIRAINTKTKPAIISTHTKNLQDQLIVSDIPRLMSALNLPHRAVSLKGRKNYLCASRLWQALQRATIKSEEAWLLIKLLAWLDRGGSGDLERVNTSHQALHVLRHVHADALSCRSVCAKEAVQPDLGYECPYQRARRQAREADIVVTNHALLVQLVESTEDTIVPLGHIVIDEAHHLEDVARDATGIDFSEHRVAEIVAPFARLQGAIGESKGLISAKDKSIISEAQSLLTDYQQLRKACAAFLAQHSSSDRLRLTGPVRRNTSWQKIIQQGSQLRGRLQFLAGLLESKQDQKNKQMLIEAIKEAEKFGYELETFLSGSSERIQWLEQDYTTKQSGAISMHDVALSVREDLEQLFNRARSTTLTSATLTTGANFSYIKGRLGIGKAHEVRLGSSFDFKDHMLIYIVDDGEDPKNSGYNAFTARQTQGIAQILSGRTLGLFTSHESVRDIYFRVLGSLSRDNIKVLAQKITGGRHNITARFQKVPSSVLLGTYSFWEGIDVPGDSLSCVIIARLPFTPPNDPVLEAVAEAEEVNAFQQISVPRMILKLRQGVGRLIRSHQDHGAIVILDGRFLKAGYGDAVLKSLPPGKAHIGSQGDLISNLEDWFGPKKLAAWRKQTEQKKNKTTEQQ